VDVNRWGVIHGIRVFVPLLIANPAGGHVANTASIAGLVAGAATGPSQRPNTQWLANRDAVKSGGVRSTKSDSRRMGCGTMTARKS
jgi:NAD(P)-dependent dehydrogenase (short-subunit alcohol dehydrogenase family)